MIDDRLGAGIDLVSCKLDSPTKINFFLVGKEIFIKSFYVFKYGGADK